MTGAQWLAAIDPKPMLEFLQQRASYGKLRLFNCHCCRRLKSVVRKKRNNLV